MHKNMYELTEGHIVGKRMKYQCLGRGREYIMLGAVVYVYIHMYILSPRASQHVNIYGGVHVE